MSVRKSDAGMRPHAPSAWTRCCHELTACWAHSPDDLHVTTHRSPPGYMLIIVRSPYQQLTDKRRGLSPQALKFLRCGDLLLLLTYYTRPSTASPGSSSSQKHLARFPVKCRLHQVVSDNIAHRIDISCLHLTSASIHETVLFVLVTAPPRLSL